MPPHVIQQLISLRRGAGLSQEAVAAMLGTQQSHISEIEQGIISPHLSTVQRYAELFRMRIALESVAP